MTPYERIKSRVLQRDFHPGQFLRVAQLADELTVSATPIREALVRLSTEGLLTEVHGRGYFVSRLTESDLRNLYRLVQLFVQSAIGMAIGDGGRAGLPVLHDHEAAAGEGYDVVVATARLFADLVDLSANGEMSRLLGQFNDRLAPVRRCEALVLEQVEAELAQLSTLAEDRRWEALSDRVDAYHQRRLASAPSIIFQLERRS